MRFKTTLPKGCTIKAGSIPVRLLSSVECESETAIKVDLVNGVGLVAMADERSIDDINNNPNNAYYCPNPSVPNKELSPSSTVSPKDTDALLATIRKHVEKIPCHDCRSVPCWYCELKRLIANGH